MKGILPSILRNSVVYTIIISYGIFVEMRPYFEFVLFYWEGENCLPCHYGEPLMAL